ncbi:MAG: hypothetical protein ACI4DW_09720 [Lachnospiraceae bacterium]
MRKNIKKILTVLLMFILIFSISSEVFKVNAEAYTVRYTIRYRLVKKKKVKTPTLGTKSDYVYIGQKCFLQALFGEKCKIFLENVASPNWRKLQSLGRQLSCQPQAIADHI